MAGVLIAHPWDTVRIRVQVNNAEFGSGWQCFKKTLKYEGVRGLFRGVFPPLTGLGFQNSVLFATYGPTLEWLSREHPSSSQMTNVFLAGCAGGASQCVVCTPLELVKIRMQMVTSTSQSTIATALQVIRSEGFFRGLFRGFNATLVRDLPSYGVWFWVYEESKLLLTQKAGWDKGLWTQMAQFFSGGLAGVAAWSSIYPIDVIKSRIQSEKGRSLSMMQAAREGYAAGGFKSFFQGFNTTMAKGFVCSGTTFLAVEAILYMFKKD